MKDIIKYRGREIEIVQEEDAQSPQEDGDNGIFLVASHRDFYVAEPGEKRVPSDPAELLERYRKTHWIFPLEAYIHGGVVLALSREGNFPDRQWDVSQLGFVFVSKEEWRYETRETKKCVSARKAALSLVAEWNQYLSGDVWGYVVGDDSCWGFYGREYCEEQAREVVDCQLKAELKTKLAKLRGYIKKQVPVIYRTFATA